MEKLKKKIIRYFILCVFLVSFAESIVDNIFIDYVLPSVEGNKPASVFIMVVDLICTFGVFFIFALIFYKIVSNAVDKESKRQVRIRNAEYSRICHDLKTPLTSIKGFSAALKDHKIKEEEQDDIINIIYNKSSYANELVESIFEYSKLETEDFKLNLKKMDICILLREILSFHYNELEKKHMKLDLDIPEEGLFVEIDEKEMRRCIDNLIINVYKHNPDYTEVFVKAYLEKNMVNIIVADKGVAIEKEKAKNIFEPFISGDEARTSGHGNGLGLAISKLIAKDHGGDLYLSSEIMGYTKAFIIKIPQAI